MEVLIPIIPVLLPVHSGTVVYLTAKLGQGSEAEWRVKTSLEKCGKSVRRSLGERWVALYNC